MFKEIGFTFILIFWIIPSLFAGGWASTKGRSFMGFFLLSVFLTPIIGIIAALIAQPVNKPAIINTIQPVDSITKLEHLAKLKESGALTEAEFQSEKGKLLAPSVDKWIA